MLKQVTVNIIIDDHEPEKCGSTCQFFDYVLYYNSNCRLFSCGLPQSKRCKECLEGAK